MSLRGIPCVASPHCVPLRSEWHGGTFPTENFVFYHPQFPDTLSYLLVEGLREGGIIGIIGIPSTHHFVGRGADEPTRNSRFLQRFACHLRKCLSLLPQKRPSLARVYASRVFLETLDLGIFRDSLRRRKAQVSRGLTDVLRQGSAKVAGALTIEDRSSNQHSSSVA